MSSGILLPSGLEQFIKCVEITCHTLAGIEGGYPRLGWSRVDQVQNNARLVADLLKTAAGPDNISAFRGAWDARGLRPNLETAEPVERVLSPRGQFVLGFMQARVELLGSRFMIGVAENLRAYYAYRSRTVLADDSAASDDYLAAEMLSWLFRAALYSVPVADGVSEWLRAWSADRLETALRVLPALVRASADEIGFYRLVEELADRLRFQSTVLTGMDPLPEDDDDPSTDELLEQTDSVERMEDDDPADGNIFSIISARKQDRYRVYERQYDQVVQPHELLSRSRLLELRDQLDRAVHAERTAIRRMARRLNDLLLSSVDRGWDNDTNEGLVNYDRLDQVVVNPLYDYAHRQQRQLLEKNTVVTLLIDNSASMRGRRILVAAICVEMIATVLERFGVPTEILGFTTEAWKGGQVRDQWVRDGRPGMPGRLNALRHIVYKDADCSMRRCREPLAAMINPAWMRENIDGEAVQWAASRLIRRSESKRFLLVISDGVPYDAATADLNPPGFLEQHLADVVNRLDRSRMLELVAIGIGHDVRRYYSRAEVVDTADDLGKTLVSSVGRLFGSYSLRNRVA